MGDSITFTWRASQNADKWVRYSNTLLVSLNNRIYFREHQPPEHGDSAYLTVSDRVRAPAVTSPCFAVPEPQLQESRSDISSVYTISRPDDGKGGDDTIADSYLVCAISCYSCYPIPTFLNSSVSLSSHTLSNFICFPEIPSGLWARHPILTAERTRCMDYDEKWVRSLQLERGLCMVVTCDLPLRRQQRSAGRALLCRADCVNRPIGQSTRHYNLSRFCVDCEYPMSL